MESLNPIEGRAVACASDMSLPSEIAIHSTSGVFTHLAVHGTQETQSSQPGHCIVVSKSWRQPFNKCDKTCAAGTEPQTLTAAAAEEQQKNTAEESSADAAHAADAAAAMSCLLASVSTGWRQRAVRVLSAFVARLPAR